MRAFFSKEIFDVDVGPIYFWHNVKIPHKRKNAEPY
jgi:hypothetical protein